MCSSNKVPVITIIVGAVLLILTFAVGWIAFPIVLEKKIAERVQLKNGTQTWERWSNVTTPIFMNFYIFNTTNPHEVAKGQKPKLEEFGPYVYEEKRVKIDIELNEENNTVFYRQPVRYFFRPDLSNGTEEDRFKILNIPLVVLTTLGADMGFMAQLLLGGVVDEHPEEELFMDITAGQLLFKGKYVPMMKTLEESTGKAVLKNHTFGLFYPKNGSDEGVLEVKTGVDDPANFGKIVSWNGQTELSFWTDQYCNMINGTDGSIFPPFVTRDRVVRLFSADLCRSLYLKYTKDVEMNGIQGYRFAVPKEELEDPRINEENSCFCTNPGHNKRNCLKAGAIQLSACRKGAPIVMSTPHFYDGSEEYQTMTEGLKPDRERHLTFVDLEPNTGLMLTVHKRIQVNIDLKANTISDHFAEVPEIIYPILWADEGAKMAEPTQAAVKGMILKPIKMVDLGKLVLIGVSSAIMAAGILAFMLCSRRSSGGYSAARTSEKH